MTKTIDTRDKQVKRRQSQFFIDHWMAKAQGSVQYPCTVEDLAQDQSIISVHKPTGDETYRARLISGGGDPQSDDLQENPVVPILDQLESYLTSYLDNKWGKDELETSIEEPASQGESACESIENDPLSPDKLAEDILGSNPNRDIVHLRDLIFQAEDTGFTVGQNSRLGPWLLDFAMQYRDSSDAQDEAVVWSAIRTGASMLEAGAADRLRPLLEPGHSVETSLVTLKMLGRIFEAQPPAEVGQYPDLAAEVSQIARDLLNRYVITASQSAAMAHLAIYALVAMGSNEARRVVESVENLGVAWFTRRMSRKLRQLKDAWANRAAPVAAGPLHLLDGVLETLTKVDPVSSRGLDAGS